MKKLLWRLAAVVAFGACLILFIPIWLFTGKDIANSWFDFFDKKINGENGS